MQRALNGVHCLKNQRKTFILKLFLHKPFPLLHTALPHKSHLPALGCQAEAKQLLRPPVQSDKWIFLDDNHVTEHNHIMGNCSIPSSPKDLWLPAPTPFTQGSRPAPQDSRASWRRMIGLQEQCLCPRPLEPCARQLK